MGLKNFLLRIAGKKLAKNLELTEGKMDDKKKWFQSKTIWSDVLTGLLGVYAVVSPILATHGVTLPPVPGWLLTVLGAMGIHGRVTADSKIG